MCGWNHIKPEREEKKVMQTLIPCPSFHRTLLFCYKYMVGWWFAASRCICHGLYPLITLWPVWGFGCDFVLSNDLPSGYKALWNTECSPRLSPSSEAAERDVFWVSLLVMYPWSMPVQGFKGWNSDLLFRKQSQEFCMKCHLSMPCVQSHKKVTALLSRWLTLVVQSLLCKT